MSEFIWKVIKKSKISYRKEPGSQKTHIINMRDQNQKFPGRNPNKKSSPRDPKQNKNQGIKKREISYRKEPGKKKTHIINMRTQNQKFPGRNPNKKSVPGCPKQNKERGIKKRKISYRKEPGSQKTHMINMSTQTRGSLEGIQIRSLVPDILNRIKTRG